MSGEALPGLVDTNVFVHAQTHDAHSEECLRFLEAVQAGRVQARLEVVVLHELSYSLRHYRRDMTRAQVAEYLMAVLAWEGIVGSKGLLADTIQRWRDTPGLGFVDAFLAARAAEDGCPVYTKNVTELTRQGVMVPNRLS